jgi:nitrite reductase (NADH) small subunit
MSARHLGSLQLVPPGEGKCFRLEGREVAVFHTREGALFATQGICPHRGGPLSDGIVGGRTLVCPLHGRKWDLATGAPIGHEDASLCTHPVRVQNGELFVELEE